MMAGLGKVHGGAVGHGGAGYAYHVEEIRAWVHNASVDFCWTDPCDDEWAGTKIVRKTGGYPRSVTDGVLVVDSRIRNQYAQSKFLDTGLVNEETYYYMAFPYSDGGVNTSYLNHFTPMIPKEGGVLSYTGNHTKKDVEFDGCTWEQWTLISSGILKIESGSIPPCKVWLCSGGSCGGTSYTRQGGLGGYAVSDDAYVINGSVSVDIGVGGTALGWSNATNFGSLTAPGVCRYADYRPGQGGTGGGEGYLSTRVLDTGDGKSKFPFGDEVNFAGRPHCAGGGGGAYNSYVFDQGSTNYRGGTGGSNGSNGGTIVMNVAGQDAPGGAHGGGIGARAMFDDDYSKDATFYGGGGGGKSYASSYIPFQGTSTSSYPGVRKGYQGVVYVRIQK